MRSVIWTSDEIVWSEVRSTRSPSRRFEVQTNICRSSCKIRSVTNDACYIQMPNHRFNFMYFWANNNFKASVY